jgi:hypothetical protein
MNKFLRSVDNIMGQVDREELPIKLDSRCCERVGIHIQTINRFHQKKDVEGLRRYMSQLVLATWAEEEMLNPQS